jgi:DNA-directed RNA polymerase specialized sigma24 family protein
LTAALSRGGGKRTKFSTDNMTGTKYNPNENLSQVRGTPEKLSALEQKFLVAIKALKAFSDVELGKIFGVSRDTINQYVRKGKNEKS